jgi:hypothetical protein
VKGFDVFKIEMLNYASENDGIYCSRFKRFLFQKLLPLKLITWIDVVTYTSCIATSCPETFVFVWGRSSCIVSE